VRTRSYGDWAGGASLASGRGIWYNDPMPLRLSPRWVLAALSAVAVALPGEALADPVVHRGIGDPAQGIPLLQPWSGGGPTTTPILPGVQTFFAYFNSAIPWMFEVAIGFCAIWILIGGIQIMVSGGGGQKSSGQSHITWALVGTLILVFAGAILKLLNNMFYV